MYFQYAHTQLQIIMYDHITITLTHKSARALAFRVRALNVSEQGSGNLPLQLTLGCQTPQLSFQSRLK